MLASMSLGCPWGARTLESGSAWQGPLLLMPVPLLSAVTSLEQSLRSLGTPSDTQELRDSL